MLESSDFVRRIQNVLRHDIVGSQPPEKTAGPGFVAFVGQQFAQRDRDGFRFQFPDDFHLLFFGIDAAGLGRDLYDEILSDPLADRVDGLAVAVRIQRVPARCVPDVQVQHRCPLLEHGLRVVSHFLWR